MSVMHYFLKITPAARRQKIRRYVGARARARVTGERGVFFIDPSHQTGLKNGIV